MSGIDPLYEIIENKDFEISQAKRQLAAERAISDKLRALVWGECPALLSDDSGGNGVLDVEINIALAKARAIRDQETAAVKTYCGGKPNYISEGKSMITLKTLPQATAQEVFDQVATHLMKQGVKSRDVFSQCAYRGANGSMCAAGGLIADNEYSPHMEGVDWIGLSEQGLAPVCHARLIRSLQIIHDNEHPEDWANKLSILTKRQGLNDDVVKLFAKEV